MIRTLNLAKLPFFFVSLFALSLVFSSCEDDEDGPEPRPSESITDLIGSTEGLESLDTLISLLGSDFAARVNSGDFTIFAPNNAAFSNLLSSIGYSSLGELRTDILSDIIFYHIVANTYLEANQLDSTITTLGFSQIEFEQEGDTTVINPDTQPDRTVVVNTIRGSNGVIHVTDKVLLSPDGAGSLASLFGTVAGITSTLGDVLNLQGVDGGISTINSVFNSAGVLSRLAGSENFTVLAPINSGFDDFFFTSNDNVIETANYHVLAGDVDLSTAGRTITTLGGATLYVSQTSNGTYLNGIGTADLEYGASNGKVIHMGGVLKPAAPLTEMVDYIEALSGNSFTIFKKALAETGIDVGSNRTIFMPTDAAFERAGIITSIDSVEEESARLDTELLRSILQKHVVTDGMLFSTDFEAATLTTLNGNLALTLEGDNGTITINDNSEKTPDNANLVFPANNLVENEIVLHVINEVLLP
ncbi:fasciclin domain-containing protein [Porifericola rhodea]|uniref:fasciclin domain-containing protein n=1 Tax=Porifericola rhodea TaxID=930972 RepID=UPI002665CA54|nr:fasciclin domain-containing protein [Porifericola rhodea]WKN31634.1 fasciclin domain-containing protein [Porifericola rhodea]